jgi:hypothetical protein
MDILTDLHVFSPLAVSDYEKVFFFFVMLYVGMYVWTDGHFFSSWTAGWISYSEFRSSAIIRVLIGLCPVNMNILAQNIGALQIAPKQSMVIFPKTVQMILFKFE